MKLFTLWEAFGWFCGVALAFAITVALDVTSIAATLPLSFGLSGFGLLLGKAAER